MGLIAPAGGIGGGGLHDSPVHPVHSGGGGPDHQGLHQDAEQLLPQDPGGEF